MEVKGYVKKKNQDQSSTLRLSAAPNSMGSLHCEVIPTFENLVGLCGHPIRINFLYFFPNKLVSMPICTPHMSDGKQPLSMSIIQLVRWVESLSYFPTLFSANLAASTPKPSRPKSGTQTTCHITKVSPLRDQYIAVSAR